MEFLTGTAPVHPPNTRRLSRINPPRLAITQEAPVKSIPPFSKKYAQRFPLLNHVGSPIAKPFPAREPGAGWVIVGL